MSEDEGTNTSAHGVSSEEQSDDGEPAVADTAGGESDAEVEPDAMEHESESTPSPDEESDSDDERPGSPKTSQDVQQLLDQVSEHDDALAHRVNAIVEEARELNGTVKHQRAELEDLSERVEEQAETIGELQDELDAHKQAVADRNDTITEHEETIEDLKSRLKRKQADFQNYKKRAKKRQQQIKDRAAEDLVERLIGVRDNLKRALDEDSEDVSSLRDGIEMTLREFDRILEDENVAEIDPEPGTDADPQRHEVMMRVDSDQPEGTIADVFTPGYEMGDKVIQNAQVTVSNGEFEATKDDTADESATDESNGESATDESQGDSVVDDGEAVDASDETDPAADNDEETADSTGGEADGADDETADAIELGGEIDEAAGEAGDTDDSSGADGSDAPNDESGDREQ